MPKTAYSSHYRRELDVEQLLALAQGIQPSRLRPQDDIPAPLREWIKLDIQCPCCGVNGARIVRLGTAASGRLARQAHFRFLSENNEDAHHRFCEFFQDDEPIRTRPDSFVDFGAARSAETVAIRELICRGITTGIFGQADVQSMRLWYFNLKSNNRFTVNARPEAFSWLSMISRQGFYRSSWAFSPVHGDLPGFDWKAAARSEVARANSSIFDLLAGNFRAVTRATELAKRTFGIEEFDRSPLEPFYKRALDLAAFFAANDGRVAGRIPPNQFAYKGAPAPLLAFTALLLSVSGHDRDSAIGKFAQIARAPSPLDATLGNVIGLNPFHDYAAWRVVKLASDLSSDPSQKFDYAGEVEAMQATLKDRYDTWKAYPHA